MSDDATLRGQASRALMALDARWARHVILSADVSDDGLRGTLPLLLSHHLVRIIYEGARLLRMDNPEYGIPEMAALLDVEFSTETTTIRHRSKLLDDTKKSADKVLAMMDAALRDAHEVFFGPHCRLVHFLCTDLGLYTVDGHVVGATIPVSFRMGFRPVEEEGPRVFELSYEWGANLQVMTLEDSGMPQIEPRPVSDITIDSKDRKADKYLTNRFGSSLTLSEKLLLLLIEGDINTNLRVLPAVSHGHDLAVFRMRTVTLYHALSTTFTLLERSKARSRSSATPLRDALNSPAAKMLMSEGGRQVRNRCVHYPLTDKKIVPDSNLPMFGLVEAVYPGVTFSEFHDAVITATEALSNALRDWC